MAKSQLMTRRSALRLFASTAGMSVLAACGGTAAPASAPPSSAAPASSPAAASAKPRSSTAPAPSVAASAPASAAAQPASQVKAGGTMRTGILTEPASLDGHLYAAGRFDTTWLIYDRLTEYDLKLNPTPRLAESWDISGDAKTIKLNLRKGVTFHDGRDFTSDDVKYNFLRVRDPKVGAGAFVNQSKWFTAFDTPDKNTIVLRSDSPRPLVFDFFERLNILDKNFMEGPNAKTKANGTGPFSFVEWAQGDHFLTKKNPRYWMSGKPYLDGVRTLFFRDPQAQVAQFESGSLDVAQGVNLTDFLRLKKDPKYIAIKNDVSTAYYVIAVNTLFPPTDNKLVRQALNYAINRKRWVDSYFGGTTEAKSLEWVPGTPMYDPAKAFTYQFDLDKAKSLLKQAGVGRFETDMLLVQGKPEASSLMQIYQADLATLGIKMNIKATDLAAWLAQVNPRKYKNMYYSPASIATSMGTEMTTSKVWEVGNNNSGYDSPQVRQLVSASTTDSEPAKL
ncbi:MAG: ABC transporter substrate-binding protein, partial [Chloroflexota bacterium]|nr:ABC transporter substrate-binding protein [Chloroflexota bacterium]